MAQDDDKRRAALAAVEEVADGMLVGLGTGTTAAFAIEEIGRRCGEGLKIEAVASSITSARLAEQAGIKLRDMDEVGALDLTIDGADEIDANLRGIKGGGGAMLREKVIAAAARRMIVIADGSKRVAQLGAHPVPLEVLPFARSFVAAAVEKLGGNPVLRAANGTLYHTDQGNLVLDCSFGLIADPATLATSLAAIPGMLGHGLFLDEVDALYVSEAGAVTRIERPAAR